MAAVNVTITGVLYDKLARTTQQVALIGEAFLTDLTIWGGPIIPPDQKPPSPPLGIWGGAGEPFPTPPIYIPPAIPPALQPPAPPAPGAPTTPVPPPAGSAGWPVQPIVPPPYIVVQYPGIGPVIVAPPVSPAPTA